MKKKTYTLKPKKEICPICNGDGWHYGISGSFSHDCLSCRGTGYINKKENKK